MINSINMYIDLKIVLLPMVALLTLNRIHIAFAWCHAAHAPALCVRIFHLGLVPSIRVAYIYIYAPPKARNIYFTWCEMLLDDTRHVWSGSGAPGSWREPSYSDAHSPFLGGSGAQWPHDNVGPTTICTADDDDDDDSYDDNQHGDDYEPHQPGAVNDDGGQCYTTPDDKRLFLSYWGAHPQSYTGGCCTDSKSKPYVGWKQPFTVHFGPLPPLALHNAKRVVAVSSRDYADRAFWGRHCRSIDPRAAFIAIVMGQVVDHYRPLPGRSYCDMLLSTSLHEWSPGNVLASPPHPSILSLVRPRPRCPGYPSHQCSS